MQKMSRVGSLLLLWIYLWVYTLGPALHYHPVSVDVTPAPGACLVFAPGPARCSSDCAEAATPSSSESDSRENCSLCRILLLSRVPVFSAVYPASGVPPGATCAAAWDTLLHAGCYAGFTFGARAPPHIRHQIVG